MLLESDSSPYLGFLSGSISKCTTDLTWPGILMNEPEVLEEHSAFIAFGFKVKTFTSLSFSHKKFGNLSTSSVFVTDCFLILSKRLSEVQHFSIFSKPV